MTQDKTKKVLNVPAISTQFDDVLILIRQAHEKVIYTANTTLIELYWQIGAYISEIDAALFERTMLGQPKLSTALRELQCLVAFELKMEKFKPEHLGQLNFYLEALDRNVKKPKENPSIGVLLCKDKDNEVVEYALSRSLSPTMVAEYQLYLPDKKLLQQKMREIYNNEED